MIGKSLGHYQITEKIGEGGMGVVYKARDTHLDRFVAIKTLPAERISDPERKRRFIQEAKAASALNHPNIVTIYDIDQVEGIDFIAMEYVSGKTLDDLIPRKGMRLSLVLKCSAQISDALARAHGAGIIHRDLKPSNVMVDDHGLVKVLDFGLAKLTEAGGPEAETATERNGEGTIVGTAAYMSPEQAEGKQVDTRSDIFSFGSMLYEMLTGQRAFRGDTKASTIAAILKEEPKSISQAAEGLPREMERIVKRCLRKDPEHRFQTMADMRVALEELKEESDSGALDAVPASKPRRRWAWAALAAVALAMLGAGAWYLSQPKSATQQQHAELKRLTSDSGLNRDPVLSPDGTRVAYASDRESEGNLDIWIQQAATEDRLRLTKNEADEYDPAFSPDGNSIAYRSEQDGGGIYVVSTLGGEPRRIVRGGRRPRFSPDGKWIAYWAGGWANRLEGGLFVIPSSGGQPRPVRPDFKRAGYPEWLPDGRHILFYADSGAEKADHDWWVTSLDEDSAPTVRTGLFKVLTEQKLTPVDYPLKWMTHGPGGGYLLGSFQSGDAVNIWRFSISPRTFQLNGSAEQVTIGTTAARSPEGAVMPGGNLRIVFAGTQGNRDIWSLPLDANSAVVKGPPKRITDQESQEFRPAISGDGQKLVYRSNRTGSWSSWVRDLASDREKRLEAASDLLVQNISRDGRRIVYQKVPAGTQGNQIYMADEGDPMLVCDDCTEITSMTNDGEMLIDEKPVPGRLRIIMNAGKKSVLILNHPTWGVFTGRLAPDERWISFHTAPRVDVRQIHVAPFHGPHPIEEKDWIPVTDGRAIDRYANWSPDGNTLYYLSEREGFRCIRAQRLDPVSKRPLGPPLDIYHFHHARLSLMNILDPVYMGFRVAADKAIFAIEERTGNIWMREIPPGPR